MNSQVIEQIQLQYKQSLKSKAEVLQSLWFASEGDVDELLKFLHKLAGSAGMYGYDEITDQSVILSQGLSSLKAPGDLENYYQTLYQLLIDNAQG